MPRSSSTTGISASLASLSTSSQPVATTGATRMASTPWAMKPRMALIWFSCFCCASANLRSTPRSSACWRVTDVSAARQPDSEPICEKPMTLPEMSCARAPEDKAVARPAARASLVMMFTMKSSQMPPGVFASGGMGTLYKVLLYVKIKFLVVRSTLAPAFSERSKSQEFRD